MNAIHVDDVSTVIYNVNMLFGKINYERGKFGCKNLHVTKPPLFALKVLKLDLLHLSMVVALCFNDLFYYNIPLHRKWVRLRCF